jgi:prepilin-type N-terminal cleavage/methylation domain-containing protein
MARNIKGPMDLNKFTLKVAKSFCASEKGFTLLELLIVVAILGVLAGLIVPNMASFIGTSHIAAANSELAQVGTAAQGAASAQTDGVFLTGFLLDNVLLKNSGGATLTAGTAAWDANQLSTYITGNIQGEYWITVNGTVEEAGGGTAKTIAKSGTAGDPWYLNLYFDETTGQFVATTAGQGSVAVDDSVTAQDVAGAAPGNQPSKN